MNRYDIGDLVVYKHFEVKHQSEYRVHLVGIIVSIFPIIKVIWNNTNKPEIFQSDIMNYYKIHKVKKNEN